jgi:hypothetical protein
VIRIFSLAALASGCSMAEKGSFDSSDYAAEDIDVMPETFEKRFRIDVLPTTAEGGAPLLAQSFWLEEGADLERLSLDLQETVLINGTVQGFAANPYGVQVPGSSEVPVTGLVTLYKPDTIVSATVETGEDGSFSLSLPAGEGYRLAALPTDPPNLPFYIESDLEIGSSEDLGEINLEYGDPVYGLVTDDAGEAVDCMVRLIDAATGIEGSSTETDASGFYMLRAEPGDYIVQVEPSAGISLPTIQTPVSFEEGTGGANVDIDVGTINTLLVQGYALSPDGSILRDAVIRLTSSTLTETSGVMTVETESNQSGEFIVFALPGEWLMEVIPPAEEASDTAPYQEILVLTDDLDLNGVQLLEQVQLQRYIVDSNNEPASNVLVTFQEQGFNNATYTAYSDNEGYLDIYVPDVALDVVLTPTHDHFSAITRRELANPAGPVVGDEGTWQLEPGRTLKGTISRPDGSSSISVIEVYDEFGVFYGSTLSTDNEDGEAYFEFRISQ